MTAPDRGPAPALRAPDYAWHNGDVVTWDECVVHVRSQGAFWGANVFEGLRAYWRADQAGCRCFASTSTWRGCGSSMKSLHMRDRTTATPRSCRRAADVLRANAFERTCTSA